MRIPSQEKEEALWRSNRKRKIERKGEREVVVNEDNGEEIMQDWLTENTSPEIPMEYSVGMMYDSVVIYCLVDDDQNVPTTVRAALTIIPLEIRNDGFGKLNITATITVSGADDKIQFVSDNNNANGKASVKLVLKRQTSGNDTTAVSANIVKTGTSTKPVAKIEGTVSGSDFDTYRKVIFTGNDWKIINDNPEENRPVYLISLKGAIDTEVDFTEKIEQRRLLMQSKYVQSESGLVYQEVKKELDEGQFVLFCGAPCQVAAFRTFLSGNSYENLYTVDFICRGMNSPKAYLSCVAFRDRGEK